jgi:hypothetical protein
MKRTARVFGKRFWLALGFVVMMTLMAAGQLFAAALSPAEESSLLYIREEEKVARDVYIALYDKWGLIILDNISRSEQTHMDAIKTLLDRYDLEDPALGPGLFGNQELQNMYDELVAMGIVSVIDALNVGVTIEKIDIVDLKNALAITVHKDIKRAYLNLMAGSEKHLAAFESVLNNY